MNGEIRPGEQLPTPAGVRASRGVMREAIKVLAAKGLVVSRPRTGTRVRPRESWNLLDPDVLAWRQEGRAAGRLPGQAHRGQAHDRAGERRSWPPAAPRPAQIAALQAALRDMRDALDLYAAGLTRPTTRRTSASIATIVQACDNEILEQMGAVVNRTLLVAFNAAVRVPGLARSSLPRHQAILDAIRRRQPNRARAAMRLLVRNTGRAIAKLPRGRARRRPRKA